MSTSRTFRSTMLGKTYKTESIARTTLWRTAKAEVEDAVDVGKLKLAIAYCEEQKKTLSTTGPGMRGRDTLTRRVAEINRLISLYESVRREIR